MPRERRDPLHLAIIMDGNGRWAEQRGLPRVAGHRAGAEAVRRIVSAAPDQGIGTLTLYAFSADNWRRPPLEVKNLMRLFRTYLRSECERLAEGGVRLNVIGRRDRLAPALLTEIRAVEHRTRGGAGLHLQIAVDYSGRDAIVEAARLSADEPQFGREQFAARIARALHADAAIPDVDLLVRTGGEQRLSDFLLWECAYAEFVFTPRLWPDFDEADLATALGEFERRERRFGGRPRQSQPHRNEG
ncbi:MAG TPA: di-trans,poly-cis-decaprenylcistransferase [Gemmatimonadota bacterium]|nr:di-trans,poly-cis-decaprenylcistransferase [Gemmatimonadota bacterium]